MTFEIKMSEELTTTSDEDGGGEFIEIRNDRDDQQVRGVLIQRDYKTNEMIVEVYDKEGKVIWENGKPTL